MSAISSKKLPRRSYHATVTPAYRAQEVDLLRPSAYFGWKAFFDRPLAALLLVPGLPIIGLLVLLVRLTSCGPGIYRQVRIGRHGRKFSMYKIRTMRHDAEVASGPVWTQARDPRVSSVGRVLRKLHLDELPQLLNVLKGEMSLVGPRPERPEFVHVLVEAIPGYLNRLVVPPGVTGLSQLNLPPDSDLDSVRRKLVLDCEYIERAGLWLDLRLLACTSCRLLKLPERWLMPVFGLRRTVTLPAIPKGGSSNNGGNGADHAAATPTSIRMQVADAPADGKGNGSSPGRHERRNKHRHRGPKPR
jgi:lipopolysaccharide/colanic/teichoic acid biosynthesis glycosyltransferase